VIPCIRAWNHSFIDAPTISAQKQPCATNDDVERAIKNAPSHQEQLLYAVLSGAGLRIAEALSIHVSGSEVQTRWDATTVTITVRSSVYGGGEQHRVKTQASNRVVDLNPRLNAAIIKFVAEQNIQPGAFLFHSTSGRAMHLRTATARLKKQGILGFHSFRRYRITRLRDLGTPEDIVRYWVGHAGEGVTDRYSKLAENIELRKEWATRAGLGFSLDHLGKPGDPRPAKAAKAAKKSRREALLKAEVVVKRSLIKRRTGQQPVPPRSGETVVAESAAQEGSELAAEPDFVAQDSDLDPMFFEQPAPTPTQEEMDVELARLEELRVILGEK
jgi:hypothetical protein